ncbi:YunG family protein [Streptomyces albipurpureus]|uniref:YunG family protein n=1 Tax=Streptomyces albipurpureus TaxID=2897419 RepID=UPI003CE57EBA
MPGCPLPLTGIENALWASRAADPRSPDDAARESWRPDNPARERYDITALVVNVLFGGDPVLGEVFLDGEWQGFHHGNRLPGGIGIDLTREQFRCGQTVVTRTVVARSAGPGSRVPVAPQAQ